MRTPALTSPISRPAGGHHPLGCPPAAAATAPVSGVDPADRRPLPGHTLADIAAGLAAARPLWQAEVRHDPDGRRPVRLIGTDRYEVWVIGWTTGQNVRMHDHGDAAGAFIVTEGELTEVLPSGGGGVVERTLGAGRLRHLPLGTVHDVVNRAPEPATSIHVYSPPLTSMTYYDESIAAVETTRVAPDPPRLDGRATSYALHPSQRSHR